ncbi:hypothetical protein O6H91_15G007700 [Diphasiastrum complanatum]|uniref:Uncharacterized protein n=1 Tax=Diphasiastrum complanatum TaxID=34168 RepID=A0ACC2BFS3_DIPCM|nr:hypothetical protein O6H91_15G007700 [Diphasiastrum complanatum]
MIGGREMDPEQTFLRVHARLSGVLARLLTPRFRIALEYICLFNALVLLTLLVIMHVNFVGQPGCAKEFSGPGIAEAQLIRIKITNSWNRISDKTQSSRSWLQDKSGQFQVHGLSARGKLVFESFQMPEVGRKWWNRLTASLRLYWIGSSARQSSQILENVGINSEAEKHSPSVGLVDEGVAYKPLGKRTAIEDGFRPDLGGSLWGSTQNSFRASLLQYVSRWSTYGAARLKRANQTIRSFWQVWRIAGWEPFTATPKGERRAVAWNKLDSMVVDRREKHFRLLDPTYLYSVEKGFLILSEAAKVRHHVQIVNISISAQNDCFGNRWQQFLIDNFVGYDTVLMNSLLNVLGQGYMYNFQTKELYNLNYLQESGGVLVGLEDYIVFKFGVLIMSLFVFFTTTMSVSFTLRETQARMLKFTVQLQHHARHRLPTYRLIFVHVFESLVFVPIMIGILFFLFEFFDDQLLAFMVLTLVWLCELFTMISVRTPVSMLYFPRFFFLYFMVFHVYFFSYPYGFSYLAFSATAAFMQHLILYFWNRFEVPALQSFLRRRALLQQQVSGPNAEESTISQEPGGMVGASLDISGSSSSQNQSPVEDVLHAGDFNTRSHSAYDGSNGRTMNQGNNGRGDPLIDASFENGSTQNDNTPNSLGVDRQSGIVDVRDNLSGTADQLSHTHVHMSTGIGTDRMQPQPFAVGSMLPWILGSPSTTLFSFFPVSQDSSGQDPASTDNVGHEDQVNTAGTRWTSASNQGTGLRQRHGLIAEESESR